MRRTRVGSLKDRFLSRFQVNEQTGCWDWTGRKDAKGYGLIAGEIDGKRYTTKGQPLLAHRASWIIFNGEIPAGTGAHGTVVMHKCDNSSCVNPFHLQLGSQADNVSDMLKKGRKVTGEWQRRKGVDHFRSSFKSQEDIDLICNTQGRTKELAEKYGVDVSTIKRIRRRNGITNPRSNSLGKRTLSQEAIDHIASTPPGTRGLAKLYGVHACTIAEIRKTYRKDS